MSSDAQSLLDKYKDASADAVDVSQMQKPNWGQFPSTSEHARALESLEPGSLSTDEVRAIMAALKIQEAAPLQYVLTLVYDMLRSDTSKYRAFEDAWKADGQVLKPMAELLTRTSSDAQWTYVTDKCAWILTSVLAHLPKHEPWPLHNFGACSDLGNLEACANLLKSDTYRSPTWNNQEVQKLVFKMNPKTSSSPILYKSVFAIWMASFDEEIAKSLRDQGVVDKLKGVLSVCRTEKVIRLCLTVLKNFLSNKQAFQDINEDIVEAGLLEVVQGLEYEKWRDTELYDDIKEVSQMISSEVKELSNFDRYMKELESGNLSWGFIHSSKFFGENVMKFETADFKAVKQLASCLSSDNSTTLAVACHDIGQFVSLHPLGKKQVARLGVKERVMELMGSNDADNREVRREALLCCQKIMLNKWQDAAAKKD